MTESRRVVQNDANAVRGSGATGNIGYAIRTTSTNMSNIFIGIPRNMGGRSGLRIGVFKFS